MATRADIAFLQCRLIYEFLHFVLEVVIFQSFYKVILKNYYFFKKRGMLSYSIFHLYYIIAQICHVLPYLVVKMSCQLIHELSFIRVYHE